MFGKLICQKKLVMLAWKGWKLEEIIEKIK